MIKIETILTFCDILFFRLFYKRGFFSYKHPVIFIEKHPIFRAFSNFQDSQLSVQPHIEKYFTIPVMSLHVHRREKCYIHWISTFNYWLLSNSKQICKGECYRFGINTIMNSYGNEPELMIISMDLNQDQY